MKRKFRNEQAVGQTTGEIVLDAPRRNDSQELYRWINDATTVRYNSPYRPIDEASHEAWFGAIGTDPSRVVFAIRAKGRLVGTVQLRNIHPIHRSAELTIRIGNETDRGKGYGTEALSLAIRFCWEDLNLQRVWLQVFHDNDRAIGAYRRAGFEAEGTLRRAAFIGGEWKDLIVMATLRPLADWPSGTRRSG